MKDDLKIKSPILHFTFPSSLTFLISMGIFLILTLVLRSYTTIYLKLGSIGELSLPWLIFILGTFLSIFLAMAIHLAQLAKQRGKNLVKEIKKKEHAEKTQKKLEEGLLQGQKLQAVGTLAGGIAHDFNNILYAIIGYIELAQEEIEKNTQAYLNLSKILEAARRGQELTSRILTFSRTQHYQMKPIDLKKTIEVALDLLRPTIPASVSLSFYGESGIITLGNPTQIHQILINLINNAVDALEDEGTIQIKLSKIKADETLIRRFPKLENKNYCKIEVIDTGQGMDTAKIERIFEPFYTTKEVGKGTGLGLSIVHSIVREHHGEITVQSQLGQGTTFTILLPENQEETGHGKNFVG